MQFHERMLSFSKVVHFVSRFAHGVGAGVLAVMMFFTALDVTLRYFFNSPIMGSFELTEYMMVIVISLSLAYCAMLKGHVNVDFVILRFPQRTREIIGGITSVISLAVFFVLSWQCFEQTMVLKSSGQTSGILFIPTYPFVGVVAIGCALTCLVSFANLLDVLIQGKEK